MKLTRDVTFNAVFWLFYFLYQWLGLASLYGNYHDYFINACMALPVAFIFSRLAVHFLIRKRLAETSQIVDWVYVVLISLVLLVIRRYINYYFLYPKYFPQAQRMPFLSAGKMLVEFVNLYTVTGLYALYYFIQSWYEERFRVHQLVQQTTKAELNLLKAQVQPHFVFNTLNNIYSTALTSSPETATLIAHLSGFLEYNLYESNQATVPLATEISYIEHYIELQKNRYGPKLDVSINVYTPIHDLQIAPLLLLPLVENCFKHGVTKSVGLSWIRIDIARQPGQFSVKIANSKDEQGAMPVSDMGGIGLSNVKKRLSLLYPDAHELTSIDEPHAYLICLTINTLNYG
ncbi:MULTISPECIES: histidine kinase [unclassified Spirosoma]|uniref:sensor histidine kinase n=1 Tax=unclassified Spirosoma TaxID=2621999 RepID=UPI00095E839B|nr:MULTISPECIES: histidine kinase [unclassified Spirosoma]MBN8824994.1 histidine kinase [Spirosoma sp.]OJW73399.1 MAG: sensor histidine kinase [Spirosoma sp. 48-14]